MTTLALSSPLAPSTVGLEGTLACAPHELETFQQATRQDRQEIARWRAEVLRLRAMIELLEQQKRQLVWALAIGAVLALPALYLHWLASLSMLVLGATTYFTGQSFSWGHLIDRRQQLRWAHTQLRKAREHIGLAAVDETLRKPANETEDRR